MKKLLLQAALAIGACFLAGQSAHATDTNTIVDAIKNRTLLDAKNMDILQKINQQRNACGFNSVKWNPQLADSARKHTNYIAYVQRKRHLRTTEKSPFYNPKPVNWNAHYQRPVSQLDGITGSKNPFFVAENHRARNLKSGYNYETRGLEAITLSPLVNKWSRDNLNGFTDPELYEGALKSLMVAPYHMAVLLNPSMEHIGLDYSVLRGVESDNGKYVLKSARERYHEFWYHSLVIEGGYGAKRKDLLGKMLEKDTGIMTYPCNNLKVLDTKLDSETPNPLAGIGRDLYKNPVGHPLFIRTDQGVAANPRNILFVNKTNGKKVDYYLLQHKNDPHKILKKNEAFIIPLQPLDKNSVYEVRFTASDKRSKAKEIKLQFET